MASSAPVAPLPPRRRSLAGPLVLIIVGVVFLLGTMGVFQWHRLGTLFARFWPLLIIIWGIVKLLEYHQAQREGVRPRGIGAGGVFLLVVLVVFGLAATQATRFNWGALRDQIDVDDDSFNLFGHTYNYDDLVPPQAYPENATLHVDNARGAVNVNVSDDNQIKVSVHKRINADSQEDADKWNSGTKPLVTVSDRTVTVNANTQGAGDHWVASDLDIFIPRKAALVIANRHGDVSVMARDGDVEISNQHGDVSLIDVNGKAALTLERGGAKLSQISGDVSIDGRANDISVEDVKGAVRLNGEFFEGVKLSKIAKSVTFKSSRTDMEFSRLDGDLDLDSGDLRANDLTGPMRLLTRSKDISLTGLSGDLRLEDQNGSVEVHLRNAGSMQVENRRGDIQVFLPDKTGFQVDARARNGEIETDFDDLKVETAHDQATAKGNIGAGGPRLVLSNEHGTIEIRKGSAITELPAPPRAPKAPRLPAPKDEKVEPTEN